MKTLNVMLSNLGGRVVPIGYEGENLYTRVRINCIEVFSEYPDATVSMVVNPPDGNMYPAVVEKSGIMVVWDISDAVLSSSGSGECQLTFTDGDVVRKSVVFGISINRSLIASGDPPEPVQEWIDKAEQTAQEIAENAANLAKQDIVESYGSIAPAIIETASGAIASFSDGADGMLVKTMNVDIDPVQDLHGYDNPWPAGGGKNLFDIDHIGDEWVNTSNEIIHTNAAKTNIINVAGGTTLTLSCNIEATTNYVYLIAYLDSSDAVISRSVVTSGNKLTAVAGSNAVKAIAGVYNMDLTDAKIQVEVGSTNTAWSPYANICPISGWTSADVTQTGKNLVILDNIALIHSTAQNERYGLIIDKPGTYTVSGVAASNTSIYARKAIGDEYGEYSQISTSSVGNSVTYVVATGERLIVFNASTGDTLDVVKGKFVTAKIQIECGSSASSYETPVGQTYTYPFPQSAGTVYGGTLTIHQDGTGTLVVDRVCVDLGDLTWSYTAPSSSFPYGYFRCDANGKKYGLNNFITSQYPVDDITTKDKSAMGSSNNVRIYIADTDYSDAASFKSAMSGTQIVYELAEPVSYELTAQQVVSLLKGVNNVWANTGDVSLEYPADTKLYIDARVAELQALILENISNS